MHNAKSVANQLLELATEANNSLTPLQLIKLVYLCHGWLLGLYGRPLVKEEVEAWKYGPVIPTLYHAIRGYRSMPVVGPIQCPPDAPLDGQEEDIIAQVFGLYGHIDGISLSAITHQSGTPWHETWNGRGKKSVISNDLIENHYAGLAASR